MFEFLGGMSSYERFYALLTSLQTIAVVGTLLVAAREISLQRRETENHRKAIGYEVYQRISNQNADLLWRASEDPSLNCVWEPSDPDRARELDEAQTDRKWGAWYSMTDEEKKCYRYTRLALELAEQAWQIRQLDMIDRETWAKWATWGSIWRETRYFRYVLEDERARLLPGFAESLELS